MVRATLLLLLLLLLGLAVVNFGFSILCEPTRIIRSSRSGLVLEEAITTPTASRLLEHMTQVPVLVTGRSHVIQ